MEEVLTAVFSDVHGNIEAFRSILADADAQGAQGFFCLGDNVGYGPEPEACLQTLRDREIISVAGNHELGLICPDFQEWFNPEAWKVLEKTKTLLSELSLEQMETFPPYVVHGQARFVHGFPPDSATIYLFIASDPMIERAMALIPERICFVGHTHVLERIEIQGAEVHRYPLGQERFSLAPGMKHLINIGSVGQPRDGDNRAKYALWNPKEDWVEIRFVDYDVAKTVAGIRTVGFPERYAQRLL